MGFDVLQNIGIGAKFERATAIRLLRRRRRRRVVVVPIVITITSRAVQLVTLATLSHTYASISEARSSSSRVCALPRPTNLN